MSESQLRAILLGLRALSPDILASAVISTDGLVIASALPNDLDEDRVGAMATAMLNFGARISKELARGPLDQVVIKGQGGYVVLEFVGVDALLCIVTGGDAKLGLVLMAASRGASALNEALG
ncbi:MAG: hypothetical protein B7Z67_02435 [Acidiphilium sp. 21-60-14]|nr:MAG: hypothetical protein B7Z67_02435 [Acidiphilium sp. 21-60-14]OYV92136.1 MAG: hypothetical protein B7Z57_02285 [Acidiphilium sp. 37-60-79]OZB38947.1 MAG: hypothetical protein B7X48_10895 [Acidiphilium sp. 34-60-192]